MQGEMERLEAMYEELGEAHLRDLYDDRETLTADGQMALARVMRAKGMMEETSAPVAATATTTGRELEGGFTPGFPGVVPSGAEAMEMALEHGGEPVKGMMRLIQFYDGLELSRACAALEEANVDFALGEEDRDALSGAPPSHAIWVASAEVAEAQGVLRGAMELFPEAEVGGTAYGEEWMTLGNFETATEADKVKSLLAAAEIASEVTGDAEGYAVEVKGTDLDRGLMVVEKGLDLQD